MKPYLAVDELADAILPVDAHDRIMVMLAAYCDASYTELGKRFVMVAGCLATVSRWKTFQSKWQAMLTKEGLPFFHMTDFESYQGHYKGWTKERHIHVMKKVATAIRGRIDFAFGRGVLCKDYEEAQLHNPTLSDYRPFTYCASQCFHAVAEWAEKYGHHGPIAYIFESGDRYVQELNRYKLMIEASQNLMKRFRWAGLHILPKVMDNPPFPLTPLQAADVWAFEARKEWENAHSLALGKRNRAVRRSARALLGNGVEIDFGFSDQGSLLSLEPYWSSEAK